MALGETPYNTRTSQLVTPMGPKGVMAELVHPVTKTCIHIVGTSHLSASCGSVCQEAISALRPQTVVLELDQVGVETSMPMLSSPRTADQAGSSRQCCCLSTY